MDLSLLKKSITLCKEEITAADHNLEKLTGRSLNKADFFNNQRLQKKRINSETDEPEIKKPRNNKDTPVISSVVNMARGRTRDDALTELKKNDPREKERCKRILGHFLGTLNSIKKDSERISHDAQNLTRMKIEKKVEETNKMVSETIKKEQSELLRTKKDCQNDLKLLNQRYRAAEAYERWKAEKEKMKGHIRTSTNPPIFYLPKVKEGNDETKLRIEQTIRNIDSMIENRKKRLLNDIDKVVKLSEVHIKSTSDIKTEETKKDDLDFNEAKWPAVGDEEDRHSNNEEIRNKENDKDESKEGSKSVKDDESIAASEDYDDIIDDIELSVTETKPDVDDKQAIVCDDNVESKDESKADVIVEDTQDI